VVARLLLHIGTHKTGSTSIQQFLRDEDGRLLASVSSRFAEGFFVEGHHTELPLLVLRQERDVPVRLARPETRTPEWLGRAEAHVRSVVARTTEQTLVYSHEAMSYVRHDDELERLRGLFPGLEVTVVVFLRERSAFLASYRGQLEAMGIAASDDPESFANTSPGSWLVDYDALLAAYRRAFGDGNVVAIDYDECVRLDGTVVPRFAELLGLRREVLPDLAGYFLNRSGRYLIPRRWPEQPTP
jgi:hypothetical protein